MRILFLTDNFPPEYNAPATRTFEHCKNWAKSGVDVTVITCFPNFPAGKVYDGYVNSWKKVEYIEGIKVIRVWSFIAPNAGTFKRTLDYLSFAVSAFFAGLFVKCDLIVATSPQFFTAVSGCALSIFKRKRWVMEVRDLWPESIKAVEAVNSTWIISLLEKIELFLYRHASRIVVVTDSFKSNITSHGIAGEKIFVIKNGVDLKTYQPQPKNTKLLDQMGLNGKFIVGYAGTHGLAHGLDFIIRSVSKLTDRSIHFLFIGDGAEKGNVVKLAKDLGVENATFIDPVPKAEIKNYLSLMDVALVPLKKTDTFEGVIPSKVFECVAMNIPILLGVDGEVRGIIEHYKAGVFFEPENEVDFILSLTQIKQERIAEKNSYVEGCQKMAIDFSRETLAQKMLSVLSTTNS
ncbi:MAG TPA: glycosyltransferase family 4 protein [Cyclobacteriaceae bacterium]|jgi:glycosyltransferase involved in cell wall biosynthesis|nr:glycosyltransferase family 4 protein [Cyclobacteriaceae bacterium]